jgi:hypothetical protein
MKLDTNTRYFLQKFKSFGGDADDCTESKVVGASEVEAEIVEWYGDYVDNDDVWDGASEPEGFIKKLLETGKSTVCSPNYGGAYDDATSFSLAVTELNLYKESKIALLNDQIKLVESLGIEEEGN